MAFSQRTWLWILLFTGVNVHIFNYSCLNIAITGMVKLKPNSNNSIYVPVCRANNANSSELAQASLTVIDSPPLPLFIHCPFFNLILRFQVGEYDWNPTEKSILMGSFSWFMGLAQLFGALLCQKYGGKKVYLFSNLFLGILSCLIPLAAEIGIKVLIVVRCLQGIAGVSESINSFLMLSSYSAYSFLFFFREAETG